MNSIRRNVLKNGLLSGVIGFFCMACNRLVAAKVLLSATPGEVEGPFYPVSLPRDQDYDLTRIAGRAGVAQGDPVLIAGRVMSIQGHPIRQARVEIWQANSAGRYLHPQDTNPAEIDPDFQGFAAVLTDADGAFLFKTVLPGAYPASSAWVRPPHVHFKIMHKRYATLITQMYFPDHPLNERDLLFMTKSPEQQALMIARKNTSSDKPAVYEHTIVLENR
ncbi:MAG: protocatechuate 3,4-dioxygenase [Nitrosomonas sp.]|nr:protocatechuate 3,4-dioxygenase [Nitrosomonas sp.]